MKASKVSVTPLHYSVCRELECSVKVEYLSTDGSLVKQISFTKTRLILCRDLVSNLCLQVVTQSRSTQKSSIDCLLPIVGTLRLHTRFLSQGKCTLAVTQSNQPPQTSNNWRAFISDAPQRPLVTWTRLLAVKWKLQIPSTGVAAVKCRSSTARLLARTCLKRLTVISPLTGEQLSRCLHSSSTTDQQQSPLTERNSLTVAVHSPGAGNERGTNVTPKRRKVVNSIARRLLSPSVLNAQQREIFDLALSNTNIFFTGGAGTGKSFLLREIIGALRPSETVVTASTGAAASHLPRATTLHMFAGTVPSHSHSSLQECATAVCARPGLRQHWLRCFHLVVDEISMIDAEYFQKLEYVARKVRNNEKPFGGIHLILCGDFLQLPPVSDRKDSHLSKEFCFESSAWSDCIHEMRELTSIYRQNDAQFISILKSIRVGRCSKEQAETLLATQQSSRQRVVCENGVMTSRLCTHTRQANEINQFRLSQLSGARVTYTAEDSGTHPLPAAHRTALSACTSTDTSLTLTVGAQVMLTCNLRVTDGLVNGARGVCARFVACAHTRLGACEYFPEIRFANGTHYVVEPRRYSVTVCGRECLRRQLPLRLAWAFSVHKSQGMTLDHVEMSLSSCFEPGQVYVALSRARSLGSVRVLDFSPQCVRAHPAALQFYRHNGLLTEDTDDEKPIQFQI